MSNDEVFLERRIKWESVDTKPPLSTTYLISNKKYGTRIGAYAEIEGIIDGVEQTKECWYKEIGYDDEKDCPIYKCLDSEVEYWTQIPSPYHWW